MPGKTALVLSAGGMFGAYQAGAWSVLEKYFQPDLVIGASVGALNGWAIAGGCSGEELAGQWTDPSAALLKPRVPLYPWRGFFEPAVFETRVEQLFSAYTPRVPFGVVVTDLVRLRTRLVESRDVTWRHLAATCAIPGGFPPVLLDGQWCVDGGLLGALPLWAAAECGATRAIAINALPLMPSRTLRAVVRAVRWFSRERKTPSGMEVIMVAPGQPLGTLRQSARWNCDTIRRWIEAGVNDAGHAIASGALAEVPPAAHRVLQ